MRRERRVAAPVPTTRLGRHLLAGAGADPAARFPLRRWTGRSSAVRRLRVPRRCGSLAGDARRRGGLEQRGEGRPQRRAGAIFWARRL